MEAATRTTRTGRRGEGQKEEDDIRRQMPSVRRGDADLLRTCVRSTASLLSLGVGARDAPSSTRARRCIDLSYQIRSRPHLLLHSMTADDPDDAIIEQLWAFCGDQQPQTLRMQPGRLLSSRFPLCFCSLVFPPLPPRLRRVRMAAVRTYATNTLTCISAEKPGTPGHAAGGTCPFSALLAQDRVRPQGVSGDLAILRQAHTCILGR